MKKIILTIIIILLGYYSYGQLRVQYRTCLSCDTTSIGQSSSNTVYQYEPVTEYDANRIADDYGPRIDSDKWHGGIDYNSNPTDQDNDLGDLIISIESGQIGGDLSQGYKRLFVDGSHDFGYGHLFWNLNSRDQSGGCHLKKMLSPNQNRYAIIIIADGDTSIIGPQAGSVIFAGDTLTVRDSITAGEPIGPTGGSVDGGNLGPHLHLYSNPGGSTSVNDEIPHNPLQYVNYADTSFNVQILKQNDTDTGITLVYLGNDSTTIQVRPKLVGQPTQVKRYPKVLDVDEVKMYIKKEGEDFNLIRGAAFESRLCLGGRIGGPARYPRNADGPSGVYNSPFYNTENQWKRTGIHPYAYRGDSQGNVSKADPWDDYYFADFVTRIHRDDPMDGHPAMIADCPSNARYNDGEYELKAVVTDVRGNTFEGPKNASGTLTPIEFTLDNFKPYIEEVKVWIGSFSDNEKLVYDMHWDCSDDCGGSFGGIESIGGVVENENITEADIDAGMFIRVHSSEPLDQLNFNVNVYGHSIPQNDITFLPTFTDGEQDWFIEVNLPDGVAPIPSGMGEDIQLFFTGNDYVPTGSTANELLDLSGKFFPEGQGTDQTCVRVPTRNQSGWDNPLPTGTESAHHFSLTLPSYCPENNEEYEGTTYNNITIDNFKPYIKGYELAYSDTLVSNTASLNFEPSSAWECIDGQVAISCNSASDVRLPLYPAPGAVIYLRALPSEALNNLSLTLGMPAPYNDASMGLDVVSQDSLSWTFRINVVDYLLAGEVDLLFEGEDRSGNELLGLQDYITSGFNVPIRTTASTWSNDDIPQGIDKTFSLELSCGLERTAPRNGNSCPLEIIIPSPSSDCIALTTTASDTTTIGANDGFIYVDEIRGGLPPYSYEWSNGVSGQSSISGLSPGTYSVTVSDALCCEMVYTHDIYGCDEITIDPEVLKSALNPPTSCDSSDGSIYFRFGNPAEGGEAPYAMELLDAMENVVPVCSSGFSNWCNLSGEQYTIRITDSNGCIGKESFNLLAQNQPEIMANVVDACEGESNGYIIALTLGGDTSYEWDNGATTDEIRDLPTGTYCVTVTDIHSGCENQACYEVGEIPDTGPFTVTLNEAGSRTLICYGTNTGKLKVNVSGGNPPYKYEWSNGRETDYNILLSAGQYIISVSDACDRLITQTYTIDSYDEITYEKIVSGCDGDGQLELIVSGGTPPYDILWEDGTNGNILTGVSSGDYSITITDAEGCTKSDVIKIDFGGIKAVHSNNNPCEGFEDGSFTMSFRPPEYTVGQEMSVTIFGDENYSYSNNWTEISSGEIIHIEFSGLSGAVNYQVSIEVGDCSFERDYYLYNQATTLDYVEFDGEHCIYDEFCKDQNLGVPREESYNIDYDGAFSFLGAKCKAPILCRGNETGENEEANQIWVRGAEYIDLINALSLDPFWNPWLTQTQYLDGVQECDIVKYCPLNFRPVVRSGPSVESEDVVYLGSGCYTYLCDIDHWSVFAWLLGGNFSAGILPSENFSYCNGDWSINLGDINSGISVDIINIATSCRPRTENLAQLKAYVDNNTLNSNVEPNFAGSELRDFIFLYGSRPYAICTEVTFCQEDFSILRENREEAELHCGEQIIGGAHSIRNGVDPITFEPVYQSVSIDCEHIFPLEGSNFNGYRTFCSFLGANGKENEVIYDRFYHNRAITSTPPSTLSINPTVVISDDTQIHHFFDNFGYILKDGLLSPKGLIGTELGGLFLEYRYLASNVIYYDTDKITTFIDDWDKKATLYSLQKGETISYIIYEDSLSYWEVPLQSTSDFVNISTMTITGQEYQLSGSFNGKLLMDDYVLYSGDETTKGFMISLDEYGNLTNFEIIDHIAVDATPKTAINKEGKSVTAGVIQGNSIKVNGVEYTTNSPYSAFVVAKGQETSAELKNTFELSEAFEVVDLAYSHDESPYTTLALKTKAYEAGVSVGFNLPGGRADELLPSAGTQNLYNLLLVTLDQNNQVVWSKAIDADNLDLEKMDMVYADSTNNLFVGLTYTADFQIEDQLVSNSGGKDLVIFELQGDNGALLNHNPFGGETDETISKMFYTDKILYFGGEIASSPNVRRIGWHNFYYNIPSTGSMKAYMSLLVDTPDDDKEGDGKKGKALNMDSESMNSLDHLSLNAAPNPFVQSLNIYLNAANEGTYQLVITNILGQVEYTEIRKLSKGRHLFEIKDANTLSSGVLNVQVQNTQTKEVAHLRVIHQ